MVNKDDGNIKLFKSSNINLINDSRYYFKFELPSELLMKRKDKFTEKFMASKSESFGLLCHSVTDILCHNIALFT